MTKKTRFNNLTDQDKSYIQNVHTNTDIGWDLRMSMLMNRFGVSERTVRRWIKAFGFSSFKTVENEEIRQGLLRNYDKSKKYYIITWAQNATPVHQGFWGNILAYADYLDANVGVIQGRYQNPTSLWSKNMESEEWWDRPLIPYMDGARHVIHDYLELLSDLKIKPTAVNPLTGLESISGGRSSIIGHPKVHLSSLPVLNGYPNKLLLTTGACTLKNYTDTKAGKKAEFHHTYGFVVVEISDDLVYHVRQVTADDDGSFTDLNNTVDSGIVSKIEECLAFVMGDLHVANICDDVVKSTMSLFEKLTPRNVVLHDIFDGESITHHDVKNPLKLYAKHVLGKDNLLEEIEGLKKFIDKYDLIKYNPVVVRSNHDDIIERWINSFDWKKDIKNARQYMEYACLIMDGNANKGIVPYILEETYGDQITVLDLDESYRVSEWELGQHGHVGSNGSRGSIGQFRKLNVKTIIGHSHTPARIDGAVQVGTYTDLRLDYNKGASSWMHCGAILHKNGKVQQIMFQEDSSFTTFADFN